MKHKSRSKTYLATQKTQERKEEKGHTEKFHNSQHKIQCQWMPHKPTIVGERWEKRNPIPLQKIVKEPHKTKKKAHQTAMKKSERGSTSSSREQIEIEIYSWGSWIVKKSEFVA